MDKSLDVARAGRFSPSFDRSSHLRYPSKWMMSRFSLADAASCQLTGGRSAIVSPINLGSEFPRWGSTGFNPGLFSYSHAGTLGCEPTAKSKWCTVLTLGRVTLRRLDLTRSQLCEFPSFRIQNLRHILPQLL
jgi:hypothetical protein